MSEILDLLTKQQIEELLQECEFDESCPVISFQPQNAGNIGETIKPSSSAGRFQPVNQAEVMNFISNQANKNTVRKTDHDAKLFKTFMISQNEMRSIEELAPAELDILFGNFLVQIKKVDGSDYEPSTIRRCH